MPVDEIGKIACVKIVKIVRVACANIVCESAALE